jgi:2-polyprenyl-6-methoxyphenol hydroxylase-like FAD-dependent oxidoreductase
MLTEQISEVLCFELEGVVADAMDGEKNVVRRTLRRVLLTGLEEKVSFGKRLLRYAHNPDGTVTAHFEDGSFARGDILVGAGGTGSAVRKQRLPEARLEDTGMMSFGGKLPMTAANRALLTDKMFYGMSMIMAPKGFGAIIHLLEFEQHRTDANFAARWPGFLDALEDDSIGWGIWGARQNFPADPSAMNGQELQRLGLELTRHWHPLFGELIRMTNPAAISYTGVRTSVPPAPWESSNVTLLGDAVHTMTPGRGAGANTALRDAALLSNLLIAANEGQKPMIEAIHEYETEMLRYSADAVTESKKQMNSNDWIHRPVIGRVQLGLTRGAMRIINAMPALKQRALENMMRVRGAN